MMDRKADAEATGFSDNRFDIITEYGSLHHVDLHLAFAEMARVLKPDGKAICQEALAHNLLIHAYRRLTPKLRTPFGHILRRSSFKIAESYFGRIEMKFFHLFSLFAVPFRNIPLFGPLLAVLELLDDVMLRVPRLKWQAWQTVFVLSEPRKNATGATPRRTACGRAGMTCGTDLKAAPASWASSQSSVIAKRLDVGQRKRSPSSLIELKASADDGGEGTGACHIDAPSTAGRS